MCTFNRLAVKKLLIPLIGASILLSGCGGGGGSGSTTTTPLVYSGVTTAAQISETNAGQLAGTVVANSSTAGAIAALEVDPASDPRMTWLAARQLAVSLGLAASVSHARGRRSVAAGFSVDDQLPCDGGIGTIRLVGTLDDTTGLGSLAVTFSGCLSAGVTLNGAMAMRIDGFDIGLLLPLDVSYSFDRLSIAGPGLNGEAGGSMHLQVDLAAGSETLMTNMVSLDRVSGVMTQNQNLVDVSVYDIYPDGSTGGKTETLSGRVYDSRHGYLDIATTLPFRYEDVSTQAFPLAGELLLTGANGAHMGLRAMPADMCRLSLDLNGTGFPFAKFSMIPWIDLAGPSGADFGDTDIDGMHNSWETVHGLDPAGATDARLDGDSDGASNIREYYVGADPQLAGPLPAFAPDRFPAPIFGTPDNSSGGGTNPTAVLSVDLNGDNHADLAIANANNNQVTIRLGDGSGGFGAATPIAVGTYPIALASADFNGDTKADLAVADFGGPSVTILLGNGSGGFGAPTTLALPASTNPTDIVIGDFNKDNKPDIAVTRAFGFSNATPGSVSASLGNGDGTFAAAQDFSVGSSPFSLATGDFNTDTIPDLVVANSLGGNLSILLGVGDGSFSAAAAIAVSGDSPRRVAVADFNRDGHQDLAVAVNNSVINNSSVNIMAGNGAGGFGAPVSFVIDPIDGATLTSLHVADLNGDTKPDLVLGNDRNLLGSYFGSAFLLIGDGAGSFGTTHYYVGLPATPVGVITDDFDGDNLPDLLAIGGDTNAGGASVVSRALNLLP